MNRIAKIIKGTALGILTLTISSLIAIFAYVIFIYSKISFDSDEMLFESAISFNSTTFYAYQERESESSAVPIETSGAMKKMHYSLEEISPYVKDGFIAVEDKIFYDHSGVDVKRTAMAAANYVLGKEKTFGASTITQQVIKNISGDNKVKVSRKLAEILRALHIEENYTKDEILEVYLNVIPMSENIYGVGAASRLYFGKEPSELTPAEAATLIGITNATSAYNPHNNPAACEKKRNIVLSVMYKEGIITPTQYTDSINTPLKVIPRDEREDRFDSWFVETVIDQASNDLAKKYGITLSAARIMLLGGGYKVYTTMDHNAQGILEEYFENEENFSSEISNGLNYAMTVADSKSGDLIALIGRVGEKKGDRLMNHALVSHVPGSVLKPIALYAPLLDEGKINWSTVFDDVPVSFVETDDGYREYPRNSPGIYDGLTTVKDAVRNSKNTVAVRLCNLIGAKEAFIRLKNQFGFDSLVENEGGLTDIATSPMALGQLSKGVSLFKLTESYSVFPSDGVKKNLRSYTKITDYKGDIIIEKEKKENKIFKESTARIMNQLLKTVTDEGTAKNIKLKEYVQVAGKTGSSGNNKDKLFIGYTPYITAGIWCGYESGDRSVVGLTKGHLEIWDEVMLRLHSDVVKREKDEVFKTDGLLYLPYCMDSGQLYSENCSYDPRGSRKEFGYFTEDNMPITACQRHIKCLFDSVTKGIACPKCPKENLVEVALISVPTRSFPMQITVTDSEFVYRDIVGYAKRPIDEKLPYFWYIIPDGEYVGISKSRKQFNSSCNIHIE